MTTNKTCGPFYKEALERYAGDSPAGQRAFAAGFVSGQAEKVYLGAAPAAMFRPSGERFDMVADIVADVASRYGLTWHHVGGEIWLCRDMLAVRMLNEMREIERDSAVWHRQRAMLCGIPENEVDVKFHLRRGYGERCD
jgi:hypothetical protein